MAGLLDKVKAQNFGERDSQIISALVRPKKAGEKLAEWLAHQISTAAGMPVQPTDDGDIYAREPDRFTKAMAALNVAGFAQGGSMPFAPKSAGGTLGTATKILTAKEIAKRNAALPIEQGGLGLPIKNTPMDRAKAMGFFTDNPVNTITYELLAMGN